MRNDFRRLEPFTYRDMTTQLSESSKNQLARIGATLSELEQAQRATAAASEQRDPDFTALAEAREQLETIRGALLAAADAIIDGRELPESSVEAAEIARELRQIENVDTVESLSSLRTKHGTLLHLVAPQLGLTDFLTHIALSHELSVAIERLEAGDSADVVSDEFCDQFVAAIAELRFVLREKLAAEEGADRE